MLECIQVTVCKENQGVGTQPICDDAALRELQLRLHNLKDLETLRRVINEEEEKFLSVDEVLARVLEFYGRFVPFKAPHTQT